MKKSAWVLFPLLLIAILIGVTSKCQEDKRRPYVFSGQVISNFGKIVPGARVDINGQATVAKKDGSFHLVAEPAARYLVTIRGPKGREAEFAFISRIYKTGVQNKKWVLTQATTKTVLLDPANPRTIVVQDTTINPATQDGCVSADPTPRTIQLIGPTTPALLQALSILAQGMPCSPGISVNIPPNGLVNPATGQPASGPVTVSVATVDLFAPDAMPGDDSVSTKEQRAYMQPYGAGFVSVSGGGNTYQPSKKGVLLTIPVDPAAQKYNKALPKEIPLLVYNEKTAMWEVDGTAKLNLKKKAYEATIRHFSAFNMDTYKTFPACIQIDSTFINSSYNLTVTIPENGVNTAWSPYPVPNDPADPALDKRTIHAAFNLPPSLNNATNSVPPGDLLPDPIGFLAEFTRGANTLTAAFSAYAFGPQIQTPGVPPGPRRNEPGFSDGSTAPYGYPDCQNKVFLSEPPALTMTSGMQPTDTTATLQWTFPWPSSPPPTWTASNFDGYIVQQSSVNDPSFAPGTTTILLDTTMGAGDRMTPKTPSPFSKPAAAGTYYYRVKARIGVFYLINSNNPAASRDSYFTPWSNTLSAPVPIAAGNTKPTNTVPGVQNVNEDTPLPLNAISVDDTEDNLSTVALSVNSGTLTVTLQGGASISAGANGSVALTLSGSETDINATLATLVYQGAQDFYSSDTLTVVSTDSNNAFDRDTVQITVNPRNDAPSLSAAPANPTFTEALGLNTQAAAVTVFSGTSVDTVESGQAIRGLAFKIEGLVDGASECLIVDGRTIALGANSVGTTATNANYSVFVTGGTATATLTWMTPGISSSAVASLVNAIAYQNTNRDDPTAGDRLLTLTALQDDGGATPGVDTQPLALASTVTVAAVNDEPALSVTPGTPTYTEDDASAASLYSGATASAVEAGQTLTRLDLTVSNVTDGAAEQLAIDGTTVSLTNGANGTTFTNAMAYTVSVAGGAAAVTLTKAAGLSPSALQTLVNGLAYQNTSQAPTAGNRTVRLTRLDDSGSNTMPNDNTTTLTLASTVTVVAVNDTPTATITPASYPATEQTDLTLHGTGLSVGDVDAVANPVQVTLDVGEGILTVAAGTTGVTVNGSGTGTVTVTGTLSQINNLLAGNNSGTITYRDPLDAPGASTTLTLTMDDQGRTGQDPGTSGTATTEIDADTATINITAVNDAPTLDTAKSPTLSNIHKNSVAPVGAVGTLVSQLVDSGSSGLTNVTDPDGPALGMAVIGADAANCTWSYSINGGTTWILLGTPASNNARLLAADANTRLYCQPAANFTGTIANAITFHAWDRYAGSGSNGGTVDLTVTGTGNATAFSSAPDNASLTIDDSPVNTVPGTFSVQEEAQAALTGISVTDADGDLSTVALSVSTGTLTVTLSGGTTISAGANGTAALTLSGTQAGINATLGTIAYQSPVNFNGDATLTVRSTDGAAHASADTTATITVTPVNDAPVLNTAGTQTLPAITEDDTANGGAMVADILTSDGVNPDPITDVDNGAVEGVAIISVAGSNGTWQYSIDDRVSWTNVTAAGAVSNSSALLLRDTDWLRFVPDGQNAPPANPSVTFRAWDQTGGTAGGRGNATTNGGTTGFSSATDTTTITVSGSNDAPTVANTIPDQNATEDAAFNFQFASNAFIDVDTGATLTHSATRSPSGALPGWLNFDAGMRNFSGTPTNADVGTLTVRVTASDGSASVFDDFVITVTNTNDAPVLDDTKTPVFNAIIEDAGAPANGSAVGTLVSALVDFASSAGEVDNVADVDSSALLGIAVTASDTTNGSWHYSTDNGATWNALGISATVHRLLATDSSTRLYFRPNANFSGTATITFRAWDRTSGVNGGTANTSNPNNGGTTSFSSATDTASLTIHPGPTMTVTNNYNSLADDKDIVRLRIAASNATAAANEQLSADTPPSLAGDQTASVTKIGNGSSRGPIDVQNHGPNREVYMGLGTWYYDSGQNNTKKRNFNLNDNIARYQYFALSGHDWGSWTAEVASTGLMTLRDQFGSPGRKIKDLSLCNAGNCPTTADPISIAFLQDAQLPKPTITPTGDTTVSSPFNLTVSYSSWASHPSHAEDGYELLESRFVASVWTAFVPVTDVGINTAGLPGPADRATPKTLSLTRSPGDYRYKVRVHIGNVNGDGGDRTIESDPSGIITVQ